jgi:CheY-like chemotaxis protein
MTRPLQVLVIDDDPIFGDGLEEMLAAIGLTVKVERHTKDAVMKLVAGEIPDLVLIKLEQKDMPTRAACLGMRGTPGMKQTPLLIYSAGPPEIVGPLAKECGAHGLLSVPFTSERLVGWLQANRDYFRPEVDLPDVDPGIAFSPREMVSALAPDHGADDWVGEDLTPAPPSAIGSAGPGARSADFDTAPQGVPMAPRKEDEVAALEEAIRAASAEELSEISGVTSDIHSGVPSGVSSDVDSDTVSWTISGVISGVSSGGGNSDVSSAATSSVVSGGPSGVSSEVSGASGAPDSEVVSGVVSEGAEPLLAPPEPEPEAQAGPESELDLEREPEPEPEAQAGPEPELDLEREPEPEPEAQADPEPVPEPGDAPASPMKGGLAPPPPPPALRAHVRPPAGLVAPVMPASPRQTLSVTDPVPVLLVDDEELVLEMLSDMLADEGYDLHRVQDVPSFRQAITTTCYGVILLDVRLTGAGGGDRIADYVTQFIEDPRPRIYLHSALPEDELKLLALQLGVEGYLTKGCGEDAVRSAVAQGVTSFLEEWLALEEAGWQ